MKILNCHIENFGVLSNFDISFKDGLTTIKEDNGKGKTTLACFIKSMFYGLATTNKRNIDQNDRKKYLPWQGGVFGGYLDFDKDGIKYRIERTFGKKYGEDTFDLYNLGTGKKSDDYTSKIGEELFELDESAFVHSTFLSQSEIDEKMPVSISAKLSNLVDNTDDLDSFDKAIASIDKRKKQLKTVGSKGEIAETENKINETKRLIEECNANLNNIDLLNDQLTDFLNKKNICDNELESIRSLLVSASTQEADAQKQNLYKNLTDECTTLKNKLIVLENKYKNGFPNESELNSFKELIENLKKYKNLLNEFGTENNENELEVLKDLFKIGVPNDSVLSDIQNKVSKYNILENNIANSKVEEQDRIKFESLKKFFSRGIPSEEKLVEIKEKGKQLEKINFQLSNKQTVTQKKSSPLLLIASTVFAILGIVFMFFVLPVGVVCLLLGFFGFVIAYVKNLMSTGVSSGKIDYNSLQEQSLTLNKEVTAFIRDYYTTDIDIMDATTNIKVNLNEYNSLLQLMTKNESDIVNMRQQQDDLKNQIVNFFSQFNISVDKDYSLILDEIKKSKTRYEELQKASKNKEETILQYKNKIENLQKEAKLFLAKYDIENTEYSVVDEISNDCQEYVKLKAEFELKKNKAKEYFEAENISELSVEKFDGNIEELKDKEKAKQQELQVYGDSLLKINRRLDELSVLVEPLNDYLSTVDELQEKLVELNSNYEALCNAEKFIKTAKDNLSQKYLGKMQSNLKKYVDMITGNDSKEFSVDTDLNISLIEKSKKRDVNYLSNGYKDIIDICMRFALIDSLFENEKPFVILDDPFINLDDDKIASSLELLNQISKDIQIIYFSCHSSRVNS